MEEPQLSREEFLFYLMEIRREDPEKFMNLVLEALRKEREYAVVEDSPAEKKLSALSTLLNHFESKEGYEDCAFIRDLTNEIKEKDGKG